MEAVLRISDVPQNETPRWSDVEANGSCSKLGSATVDQRGLHNLHGQIRRDIHGHRACQLTCENPSERLSAVEADEEKLCAIGENSLISLLRGTAALALLKLMDELPFLTLNECLNWHHTPFELRPRHTRDIVKVLAFNRFERRTKN